MCLEYEVHKNVGYIVDMLFFTLFFNVLIKYSALKEEEVWCSLPN